MLSLTRHNKRRLRMGEGKTQNLQDPWSPYGGHGNGMKKKDSTVMVDEDDQDDCRSTVDHPTPLPSPSSSQTSSIGDDSTVSNGSSSSIDDDIRDDASSITASSSSSSNSTGALYDLSELMAELPIKRGLSQYYHGKSDSFTCLSSVRSVEDLPKKEAAYRRKKNKRSKNMGGGLDAYKSFTLPRPVISKKTSRASLLNISSRTRGFIHTNSRPPRFPSKN